MYREKENGEPRAPRNVTRLSRFLSNTAATSPYANRVREGGRMPKDLPALSIMELGR